MKIKAIIVEGELPEGCNKCPYAIYDDDSDGYICMAKVISEYDNLIDDMNIRQSWCPLIKEKYLHKYTMIVGDYDIEIGGTIPSVESEDE